MIPAYVYGFEFVDYHTEPLNTAIDEQIQAQNGHRLALIDFEYLNDTTAHTCCLMFARDNAATGAVGSSRNTCTAAVLSGQKDIITVVAPESPGGDATAAADIIAYQLVDGTWEFNTVTGIVGSTISLTNDIAGIDAGAGAVAMYAGAKVMNIGIIADGANFVIHLLVSVITRRGEGSLSVVHPFMGEPFYMSINNITAAGWLNYALFAHINK